MSHSTFDDFLNHLNLPDATCEQVHPVVDQFLDEIDLDNPDWTGDLPDWMEQASACLTTELTDLFGPPPTDPDDLQGYLWSVVRMSWLFYRRYHDGEPFNT